MSQSGNAILAMVNRANSAKKIKIHRIEIYNNSRFGATHVVDTNSPAPIRLRYAPVTAIGTGDTITPVPMDSSAAAWPATVQVKTRCSYTPTLIQIGQTLANTTVSGATYTPGTAPSVPIWGTNEHREGMRYFVCTSGLNAGTYRILSNTNTAITVDRTWPTATISTPGYIAEVKEYGHGFLQKQLRTDTTSTFPQTNYGMIGKENKEPGQMYARSAHSNTQPIAVRANEKFAVFADFIHINYPMEVHVSMVRSGTPNRTFVANYFTALQSEEEAIFAIDNNSGSGETIFIEDITVTELGTLDTPYLQVVPVGSLDPMTLADATRSIGDQIVAFDSTSTLPSNSVMGVYLDSPMLPYGVPASYIAEGSVAAIPKGFSYINTKDFLGPVYMTYFPEAPAHRSKNATYWTQATSTPGQFGSNLSQNLSTIKGKNAPIVLREGEGIAIVSGAETAAGTGIIVGTTGWNDLEFNIIFSVETSFVPYLNLTGLISNSEVRVFDYYAPYAEIGGVEESETTFSTAYDYSVVNTVNIVVMHLNYNYIRLTGVALSPSANVSIPIQQATDRVYGNPT